MSPPSCLVGHSTSLRLRLLKSLLNLSSNFGSLYLWPHHSVIPVRFQYSACHNCSVGVPRDLSNLVTGCSPYPVPVAIVQAEPVESVSEPPCCSSSLFQTEHLRVSKKNFQKADS